MMSHLAKLAKATHASRQGGHAWDSRLPCFKFEFEFHFLGMLFRSNKISVLKKLLLHFWNQAGVFLHTQKGPGMSWCVLSGAKCCPTGWQCSWGVKLSKLSTCWCICCHVWWVLTDQLKFHWLMCFYAWGAIGDSGFWYWWWCSPNAVWPGLHEYVACVRPLQVQLAWCHLQPDLDLGESYSCRGKTNGHGTGGFELEYLLFSPWAQDSFCLKGWWKNAPLKPLTATFHVI